MEMKLNPIAVCFIGYQIYGNVSQIYVLSLTKVEFHASLYVHIMVSVIFVRKFPLNSIRLQAVRYININNIQHM